MIRIQVTTIAAFVGLVIVMVIGGCGSEPKDPTRFYADDFDYSIKFPEGWEIEIEEDGAVVSGVSPLDSEDDMLYETVSVSVEEMMFSINLDEYFNAIQKSARSDFAWFDVELVEDVTIGGNKAKRTIFTWEDQGETVVTLGYCLVKGNKAYLITCISTDYDYDYYAADFEGAAESFRFE